MELSKKELEIILSAVRDFNKPKPELEQYATPSDIAAVLLWTAFMDKNIKDKKVADLGCGTGILSVGSSILGAKSVIGYDVDKDALGISKENVAWINESKVELGEIKFEESDIKDVKGEFDTVVMNPPFGVQKEHADKAFLEKAFEIAKVIYSIHKSGSDQFLTSLSKSNGFALQKIGEGSLNLKATMPFHEKEKYPVNVSLWKFYKE